ncbi:MAG: YHS domain-containing protein [Candidatus Omnitrophica bacterium]|nr:YHS domain-containing protein [Candidatus Omnitrophota bacterium]
MKKIMKCGLGLGLVFGFLITIAAAAENPGVCPVLGKKASLSNSYPYGGETYYFCSPECVTNFQKEPEKYLSRIKEITLLAQKYTFIPMEIKVKQGDLVKITFISRKANRSLIIKEYNINVAAKQNEEKKIEFLADKKGTFIFYCPIVYSGEKSEMSGKLIVE